MTSSDVALWHVLRAFVGSPLKIAELITERGFEAYCPSYIAKTPHPFHRDRILSYHRPLFPGYLFVLTHRDGFHWSMIEGSGVRARFYCIDNRCVVLSPKEIEHIRLIEAVENEDAPPTPPARRARAGETVKILAGALFGRQAFVERIKGQRAKIRLKSAEYEAPWFIRLDQIEPVDG